MSALVAGSVTYTINSQTISNFSKKAIIATIAYGDSALTYPSGGVPLTGGSLGLPNVVESLEIIDHGTSGYMFSWDSANNKLKMFYPAGSHGHSLFLKEAAQADAANNRVNAAASNKLGANTGTSITVVASDGATNGGVVTNAGVVASEVLTSLAPAALSVVVRCIGY